MVLYAVYARATFNEWMTQFNAQSPFRAGEQYMPKPYSNCCISPRRCAVRCDGCIYQTHVARAASCNRRPTAQKLTDDISSRESAATAEVL